MATYVSLVTVDSREFQNVQELASLWGEIRRELQRFDVELRDTFAAIGAFDFLILFDAPDRDTVFQAALTVESYGLDAHTMPVEPTEKFADLVDDRA